jgi:hypothetical protein
MNATQQLELGLDREQGFRLAPTAPARASRAQWWFAQMRQAVHNALDWQSTPPAPPEQTWLLPHRQPRGA